MQLISRSLAGAALMFAIAACTVTFEPYDVTTPPPPQPTPRPSQVMQQFVADRGMDATYRIGQPIGFRIRTSVDGYVTLTAIDPDGSVYVFARNVPVRGGRTNVIDGLGPRQRFVVTQPVGWHRVVAHFTPRPTNEVVTFQGVAGYEAWQARIHVELQPYPSGDYRETRFYVRR